MRGRCSLSDIKVAGPNSTILTVRPRAWRLQCAARSPKSKYPSWGFWGCHLCMRLPASCEDVRIPLSHHQACRPDPQHEQEQKLVFCLPFASALLSSRKSADVQACNRLRTGTVPHQGRGQSPTCQAKAWKLPFVPQFQLIDAALGHRKQLCV